MFSIQNQGNFRPVVQHRDAARAKATRLRRGLHAWVFSTTCILFNSVNPKISQGLEKVLRVHQYRLRLNIHHIRELIYTNLTHPAKNLDFVDKCFCHTDEISVNKILKGFLECCVSGHRPSPGKVHDLVR